MKFRNFMVDRTSQQAYFKEGCELLYPNQDRALHLCILPAYDPGHPEKPTGWVKAVDGDEESDFYAAVRSAKFVGHGGRMAKTAFLSPKTFDLNAEDPYEAFVEYCAHSERWSYLTKRRHGHRLSGEPEGAIFPKMQTRFVANVLGADAGSRGGVYVAELSEDVAKSILYSMRKSGRVNGLAFERTADGELAFGDITDPGGALVVEVAWTGRSYTARPAVSADGRLQRREIPEVLLQHRRHMEDPESFLVHPGSPQDIVDRIADLLRGFRSPDGADELHALEEAMNAVYGPGRFVVRDSPDAPPPKPKPKPPRFEDAAKETVEAEPEAKAEAVDAALERGVEKERHRKAKEEKADEPPGEDIDPSDIAAVRAMLSKGRK